MATWGIRNIETNEIVEVFKGSYKEVWQYIDNNYGNQFGITCIVE